MLFAARLEVRATTSDTSCRLLHRQEMLSATVRISLDALGGEKMAVWQITSCQECLVQTTLRQRLFSDEAQASYGLPECDNGREKTRTEVATKQLLLH